MAATDLLVALAVTWVSCGILFLLFPRCLRRPLPSSTRIGAKKNVLLVVAHPDDESMFFGPTLQSLAALNIYNVRVLCLSTGNADGLGEIRKGEMVAACAVLEVPEENVKVLNDSNFQDGFQQLWKLQDVAKLVREEVADTNINYILTFDRYGVSGHPNHIAVSHGVRAMLMEDRVRRLAQPSAEHPAVDGWELVSKNCLRKFGGPCEVLVAFLERYWYPKNNLHVFVNPSTWVSTQAMRKHRSQWLWFRRLFVVFSSYSYVNTLQRIRV